MIKVRIRDQKRGIIITVTLSLALGLLWVFQISGVAAVEKLMDPGLIVNIPALTLYVHSDGEVVAEYPVSVGRPEYPTPTGEFRILNLVKNPTWWPPESSEFSKPVPPGRENPLGPYWLGLNLRGYGIHGNNDPESIGTAATLGCIRMHNEDIFELVEMVEPGTRVRVVNSVYELRRENSLWKVVYRPDLYKTGNPDRREIKRQIREVTGRQPFGPLLEEMIGERVYGGRGGEWPAAFRVEIEVDGERLERSGYRQKDRLMLPARDLATAAGEDVHWLEREKMVRIRGVELDGRLVGGSFFVSREAIEDLFGEREFAFDSDRYMLSVHTPG